MMTHETESDWRCSGAVPLAAVMGARRIFFQRGKSRDAKKLTTLLVVTLKTQVFTVTTNAQNTLQHFQGASALKSSKHFIFFEGGACVRQRWRLYHGNNGTMASPSLA